MKKVFNSTVLSEMLFYVILLCSIAKGAGLYDVVNIKPGDSLNIRKSPGSDATVLGKIPFNANNVTVFENVDLKNNQIWSRIKYKNVNGWVNKKYLNENSAKLPSLKCFGNEPYWLLSLNEPNIFYKDHNGNQISYIVNKITVSINDLNIWHIQADSPENKQLTIFLIKRNCSDGMSDRVHTFEVLIHDSKNNVVINGCCNCE